jgi:hypothetical protein
MHGLRLELIPFTLGICRFPSGKGIPQWATSAVFFSATGTSDELSVVCPEASIPDKVVCSRGWRALKVEGPLDFSEVGVLAALAEPLAGAGIPIFVVSTYDTDILLVRSADLEAAVHCLEIAGHRISV